MNCWSNQQKFFDRIYMNKLGEERESQVKHNSKKIVSD